MLPKTERRHTVLFAILMFPTLLNMLRIQCVKLNVPIVTDLSMRFDEAMAGSFVYQPKYFLLILFFVFSVFGLNATVGQKIEWRGILDLYRRWAENRGARADFTKEGKMHGQIWLNADGVPLRLLLERYYVDRGGKESSQQGAIAFLNNGNQRSLRHAIKIIMTAPRPFADICSVRLNSRFLLGRSKKNINEYRLKKRLSHTFGDVAVSERWIERMDAVSLAELDVNYLAEIQVIEDTMTFVFERVPDNEEKIDLVVLACARLYRDFQAVDGQGTMAQFYKI